MPFRKIGVCGHCGIPTSEAIKGRHYVHCKNYDAAAEQIRLEQELWTATIRRVFDVFRYLTVGSELTEVAIKEALERGYQEAEQVMRNQPTMPGYFR